MLDAACQIIIPLARDHLSTLGNKFALDVVSVIASLIWDEELILTNLGVGVGRVKTLILRLRKRYRCNKQKEYFLRRDI
jgi:hypothetical protein